MNDNDEENITVDEKIRALTIASRKAASVENASTLVDVAVAPVVKGLKWNNILSGAFVLGIGGFLAYVLTLALSVQTVQAQEKVKIDEHDKAIESLKASQAALDTRLGTVERSTIRSEVMNEQIVIRLGMVPPPKLAADGGTQ